MELSGKKLLVGVCGGIAAYKTAYLVRELVKHGARVRVVMTEAARQFIAPLTFETLCGEPVGLDLFPAQGGAATVHIDWARWADAIVICPATANTIAKLANGLADNLLTSLALAATVPLIVCPAMNVEMYNNPLYRRNESRLREAGVRIVDPEAGELACGEVGAGRLAETEQILWAIQCALFGTQEFRGRRFLITAGPTREPIDPVRYLSNRSSGKMGFAIAEAAVLRGAEVTLISGPTFLKPRAALCHVPVTTAEEMAEEVEKRLPENDVLIMAAAPADFRCAEFSPQKRPKSDLLQLTLVNTTDILRAAGERKGNRIHVGFSLETDNGLEKARRKLEEKNCDIMVLNPADDPEAGFEVDTNKITLIFADGREKKFEKMSKRRAADEILNAVGELLRAEA
ncbi:MAG: bifunctional phosphopantothenoylcysteine decarboxylase/phosphopantothenate--cysteine ligase CoaBC [candidate division KSB1 bacterium]|nr:bifunctional phosphopantothenoylcysteine decarboxylase/phosphopantothenate--cysteine ligase CoaBC [candidate division KSB1 bacterium]MDZ7347125.1 bifunctional phosphopantothenoylcysteine decarboxylase/phosphopantothenate--cysteine ligase CoaBC [candidate division KSB1 bacterium]